MRLLAKHYRKNYLPQPESVQISPLLQSLKTGIFDVALKSQGDDWALEFHAQCLETAATAAQILGRNLQFLTRVWQEKGLTLEAIRSHWCDRDPKHLSRINLDTVEKRKEAWLVECATQLYAMGVCDEVIKLGATGTREEAQQKLTDSGTVRKLDDAGWRCVAEGFARSESVTDMRFVTQYYFRECPWAGEEGCHQQFLEKVVGADITAARMVPYLYGLTKPTNNTGAFARLGKA